ncbi:hypothetical protein RMATCC62417_03301 [Rhizopus microsporus]|nr:hypothetical protein RMATCC62417_03301 [Rhizopus microsporus]
MNELYCKALYDYDTDQTDELSIKEGEIVRILNKDNADWWLAEKIGQSTASGLVPSNFLETVHLGVVVRDYEAHDDQETSLKRGDKVILLENQGEWTIVEVNGKTGRVPSSCVEEYSTEKSKTFKLAAYGVKQGGIGSILAGGILKRSSTIKESEEEGPKPPPRPTSDPKNMTTKAMVIHDYSAENNDEIELMRGEHVTVLEQNGEWWKGSNERGHVGIFPANFVQIIDQTPPPRPTRARPATVQKQEESMGAGGPPPVPVGTRPTSLLTNRESPSPSRTPTSPPSRPVTSPPSRPVTSPPPRPMTAPRPPSINTHKRTPSIPAVSPDLPPLSPVYSTRPVVPRPTSSIDATMTNMAKPPKIVPTAASTTSTTPAPTAPPRPSSTQESHPPIPKRSMPSPPAPAQPSSDDIQRIIDAEIDKLRQEFEMKLQEERKRLEELILSRFSK